MDSDHHLTVSNVAAHTIGGSGSSRSRSSSAADADELQAMLHCKLSENDKLKLIIKKLKNEMQLLNILKNSSNINLIVEKLDRNNKLNELNDIVDVHSLKRAGSGSSHSHHHSSSKTAVSHVAQHNGVHHHHQTSCVDDEDRHSQNSNSPSPSLSLTISNTSTDSHYNTLSQLSPISTTTNDVAPSGEANKQFDDIFVSYLNTNVHYDPNTLNKLLSGVSSTTSASLSVNTAATSPMSSAGSVNYQDVPSKSQAQTPAVAASTTPATNEHKREKKKGGAKQKRQSHPKQVYIYPDGTKTTLTLSGKPRKKYNTKKRREAAAAAAAELEKQKKAAGSESSIGAAMCIDPLDIIPKITDELNLVTGNPNTNISKKTSKSKKNSTNANSNDLNLSTMKKELSSINEEDFANLLLKGILENDDDIIINADNLLGADIFNAANKNLADSSTKKNNSSSLLSSSTNNDAVASALSGSDFVLDDDYDLDIEEDIVLNSLKLNRAYSLV